MDVTQICKEKGIIRVGVSAAAEKEDIEKLNDIKLLLEAKEITAQASQKLNKELFPKLTAASNEAKTIVFDIFKADPSAPASKMFKEAIDKVRKSTKIDAPTKKRATEILVDMVDVSEKAEEGARKLLDGLSPYAMRTFRAISANIAISQGISQTAAIIYGKLSQKYQEKVDLAKDTSAEVSGELRRICFRHEDRTPIRIEPRRVVVAPKVDTPKPVKPKWYKDLDLAVRLDVGYIFKGGADRPEILAGDGKGVVPSGRLSGSYKINNKVKLQADYRTQAAFDVEGKEKVSANHDDARLSVFFSPNKKLDGMVQLGWQNDRSDYPSVFTPDQNVGMLNSRFNIRPKDKLPLSINIDEELSVGTINNAFPIDAKFTVRALLRAGVSYAVALKALTLMPFAGGEAGYFMDREQMSGVAYGGYAGLGIKAKKHEANVMAEYNNVRGLLAIARYAYIAQKWGVAANVFYQMYAKSLTGVEGDQQIVGGEVQAMVKAARFGGRALEIIPGVRGAYETGSGVFSIFATLGFRYGSLRPALPSILTPNTAAALPEER